MNTLLRPWHLLVIALIGWTNRRQQDVIDFQNAQIDVLLQQLGKRRLRLTDAQRIRLAVKAKFLGRQTLAELTNIVTPDTLLCSHRQVANILKAHVVEPAPQRERRTSWRTFLKAHWETLAAVDFTTTEVWTLKGLVTVYMLVVIELKSRRVELAGVSPSPDSVWMTQVTRHLTDPEDGLTSRAACNHGTRHSLTSARVRFLARPQ